MYKDISCYGVIGNMYTAALISDEGSVDYLSLPYLDSPTIFAALLDDEKGGFFSIKPQGSYQSRQSYIKNTNILKCLFKTEQGEAELIDFMPKVSLTSAEFSLHRCLKVKEGKIDFFLQCLPRPDYARNSARIEKREDSFIIKGEKDTFFLSSTLKGYKTVSQNPSEINLKFTLSKGEEAHFNFYSGEEGINNERECSFLSTKKFWQNWLKECQSLRCIYLGEYEEMINRSLLVLKLLNFQPTGAISASVTTSLPEAIGRDRNWDYRFSWIRDASFTLKAFFSLSHIEEAQSYLHWLYNIYSCYGSRNLQIMYSLKGEADLKEETLNHLKGYQASKPVRVGNNTYLQRQWDIYGEVMDAALRLSDYAGKIDIKLWQFLRQICNLAAANWRKPDNGIWEVRGGFYHFVYSKVMCWVALDRGIKIARRYGFSAPLSFWEKEREIIKNEVIKKGYDRVRKTFFQRYEAGYLDASSLLFPLLGFLPIKDRRIKSTINNIKEKLMEGGFLKRYNGDDGFNSKEGSFILYNFWLVECLVMMGKIKEAKSLLKRTEEAANHLGLFSEEYDPGQKKMLGNFPQGFSHIGYINAAMAVLKAENKKRYSRKLWAVNFLRKKIPLKIVLNKGALSSESISSDLAAKLKKNLGELQGAFFDVEAGKVDYLSLKNSKNFLNYQKLAGLLKYFDLNTLGDDRSKKAFWINIYNILVIHGVIELQVQVSVKEVNNFFSRIGYLIGGYFFTADDIEHGILRRNRPPPSANKQLFFSGDKRKNFMLEEFDPRVHFALVCASSSCPPVEFYDEKTIQEQLNIAARSFMNRRGFILDREKGILYLSRIFKWYAKDFGKDEKEIVNYLLKFMEDEYKEYIIDNLSNLKIKYLDYNWQLNQTL